MDQCTENYHCLVINNNSKSNKLEDQVFWYKGDPHEDFRLCKKEVWDWHFKHLNKKKQTARAGGGVAVKPRLEDVTQSNHKISVDVEKLWDRSIGAAPR